MKTRLFVAAATLLLFAGCADGAVPGVPVRQEAPIVAQDEAATQPPTGTARVPEPEAVVTEPPTEVAGQPTMQTSPATEPPTGGPQPTITVIDPISAWFEELDPDSVGFPYFVDDNHYCLYVLDIASFDQSEAMRTATKNGWAIELLQARYSQGQLLAAQQKLVDARERFSIGNTGIRAMENRLFVETLDASEANCRAIREYCGIDDILIEKTDSLVNPTT